MFFVMRDVVAPNAKIKLDVNMRDSAHGAMATRYFVPPLYGIASADSVTHREATIDSALSEAIGRADTEGVVAHLSPSRHWQGRSRATGSQPRYQWHILQGYSKSTDYTLIGALNYSGEDLIYYLIDDWLIQ
jgi:hypothetical protein